MTTSPHRTLHRHRGVTQRHAHAPAQPDRVPGRGQARSRTARFGEISVTYLEHGPVRLDTPELSWGSDPETLRLVVVVEGEVSLRHSEAAATLSPRDSALILGTSLVAYSSEAPARIVICDLPTDHAGLTALPRSAPFVVGRADAAVPCALGAFLLDLLRQDADRLAPLSRAQVADVLRTLATSTIMALAVAGCSGWEVRRQRLAALRHIAQRYTDPELSSASVAEHLGLSRRSLQRLFEGEERTVAQRIQEVRTQHAITRLRDPRLAAASLTEIATLSGFGSTVAMRRAVQEATGLTPSELRRDSVTGPGADDDHPVDHAIGSAAVEG
ncbi:transcriptional regulator, AraC family [Xylanimonas cellulosilytica DSM 15894]|uniref:Transcriptional regulator, AraC family n=1 Tax=Xylanimonas cellulosilytica (strain DSM 15894 / JCM 12276 / CECT 5975 / KCTC 9989 / LMG 20990 / NBRC 107835 / XIL07) TaxID=446471 RepID=D1BT12_XYLCX|nr:AraC family transcriptional regulator [Xylanimonas cellulosilytica]ACZ30854.1 transcriptional regulator, AraC family [Xylanimonas cellulosilytica DSM 15894]